MGNSKRDPRGWSVTVTYFALLSSDSIALSIDESSEEIAWLPVADVLETMRLAFDHGVLLNACYQR